MGIRRQVIEFDYGDDGFQSIESLESFPEKQQSIISSGFGNATEPSAATKVNQFITVEAMGSTIESYWLRKLIGVREVICKFK